MFVRRVFLRWMFLAVVVLPLWPLLGWVIFDGNNNGWDFLGLLFAMPILFIALLAVTLLIYGRAQVRRQRALEWGDVAVLAIWHATIIGFGIFGSSMALFGVLGVIAGLGALWYSIWRLFREAAVRTREAMAEFERLAQQQPGVPGQPGTSAPRFEDDGEYIVIEERPRDS
ncbi:hypothetical protein M2390_000922 [Mycetocola sp. BIGb0189]|uniref:hypothetical protein n=1 Tax=Mycetocola sp. BIGb0189 TaxID=2940604 RepID=UPI002169988C|nr:hypothetical protein [Mycetocola sp. BIGb0189]MCS4275761.1 hypothetical protein [Mycetocola sp. BIGb0189]